MKKEIRLKDLLVVDPTDGSYDYDPLDIMVTAYKKRKRSLSEVDPGQDEVAESLYDTMSKHELNMELRRVDMQLKLIDNQNGSTKTNIDILQADRNMILKLLKEYDASLDEALTTQQRLKRRQTMKRFKSRLQIGRKRALKRRASTSVLKARANRAARNELAKRLLGGKNRADASYAVRSRIEKMLATKKSIIRSLAARQISKIRARETARFSKK